jgi:hypothetical protein
LSNLEKIEGNINRRLINMGVIKIWNQMQQSSATLKYMLDRIKPKSTNSTEWQSDTGRAELICTRGECSIHVCTKHFLKLHKYAPWLRLKWRRCLEQWHKLARKQINVPLTKSIPQPVGMKARMHTMTSCTVIWGSAIKVTRMDTKVRNIIPLIRRNTSWKLALNFRRPTDTVWAKKREVKSYTKSTHNNNSKFMLFQGKQNIHSHVWW